MADNKLLGLLDTGAAFGFYPQMKPRRQYNDRKAAADAPLSLLRGWAAGTLGLPSDLINLLVSPSQTERFGEFNYDAAPQLPYGTEYFNKSLPGAGLNATPTGQAFTTAGNFAGGVGVPQAAAMAQRGLLSTGKTLGPVAAQVAENYLNRMGMMPGVVESAGGRGAKASNARQAEVARSNRRVATTGQYVGAPPGVNSPQGLGAMVNNYVRGMEEGLPGRNFYTDSSQDIWARTGQNMTESDLLAQNIATLSRANNVAGNTSMSAKAHIQAATGDAVNTGRFPSKDSPPLQAMYDAGQAEYLGHKRDPFATQLGVEYAPERIGRGVNDMHEAELMGYPSGKVAGATQHDFMDEVRSRAIARANATSLGGFNDWNTGNAQAAAWTGNKIRRGDLSPGDAARSYADYFPLHEANATYEAVSSPVTGHLQGLLDAPFDARKAYTMDPRGSWNTSASGRDIGYTAAGMLPGETVATVGRFKDSANPAFVARPVTGTQTAADGTRVMTPGSDRALTAVEASRAYFDAQEAGAWHRLLPAENAAAYSGAGINFGRPFTRADMEKVAPLFESKGYYLASAPDGLTVMANDSTKTGKDFAAEVRGILKTNKEVFAGAGVDFGALKSNYVDYGGAWQSGTPGAVTNEMLKYLDAAPKTAGLLDASQGYRSTVLARNARDADAAKAGYGVSRPDMERARQIFAKDGYEGLRRAAAAGTVPAAAMVFFGQDGASAPD